MHLDTLLIFYLLCRHENYQGLIVSSTSLVRVYQAYFGEIGLESSICYTI